MLVLLAPPSDARLASFRQPPGVQDHLDAGVRQDGPMRNPRPLVLIAVMLGALLVGSSLVPDPDRATKPVLDGRARVAPTVEAQVTGTLPADRVVRAEVGELVELAVTAAAPTGIEIPALGELDTAAPGVPARFTVLAQRRGRFEVREAGTGRRLGVLEVG
jgi:hypothetical protein